MAEKRTIMFDHGVSPYLSGEVAAFGEEEAHKLLAKGLAHYVKKNEEGEWVDDPEGVWEDEAAKPDDGNEPAPKQAKESAKEGAEEEGEGEDAKGVKRTRAKL